MSFSIAIIGRPNVGKSSLFNRLAGRKLAIVNDVAGVTRDWKEAPASLGGLDFKVVDTAGLEVKPKTAMEEKMRQQTEAAVVGADLVLFMLDARAGVVEADKEFARWIRKRGKKTLVILNKCEGKTKDSVVNDALRMGFGDPVAVSAEHNLGMADLFDALSAHVEEAKEIEEIKAEKEKTINIAILGRPNVGKSTLFNAILGEERTITSEIAGTTRDAITVAHNYKGHKLALVDTAGMRKKPNITEDLEKLSVGDSLHALKYANVVVLVVDGQLGIEKQDLTIADLTLQEGRCLVIAINKWDVVEEQTKVIDDAKYRLEKSLSQVKDVPLVFISAKYGKNIDKLFSACFEVYEKWNSELSTGKLNRWLENAAEIHPPPLVKGGRIKLRYMTQTKIRPPSFLIFVNKGGLPQSYINYLSNSMREEFQLGGIPIRFKFKKNKNPFSETAE